MLDYLLKITCVASFFAYFFLVDFPEKADKSWKFLDKAERDFIIRRVNKDRGDALTEKFTITRFLKPGLDVKIWILAFLSLWVSPILAKLAMVELLLGAVVSNEIA